MLLYDLIFVKKVELFEWTPLKRFRKRIGGSLMGGNVTLPFLQHIEIFSTNFP
jgi:hypothetical protein